MTPTQQSHSLAPSASLAVKKSSAEYKKEGEGILLQQTPLDPFPASKTVMASESEDWTLDDQDTAPITPEGFFVDQEDSQIRHFKNLTVNDDDNTPAFGLDGEDYDIEGDDENIVPVAVDDDHEDMIRVLNEEEEEDNERLIQIPTTTATAMTMTTSNTGGIKSILSQGRFSYNSLPGISEERELVSGGMSKVTSGGSKTSLLHNSSRTSLNELEEIQEGRSSSSSTGGGLRRMGGSSRTSLNDIISNNSDEETWKMRGGDGGGYDDNSIQQRSPMRMIGGDDHIQDEVRGLDREMDVMFGRHRPQSASSSPERAMPPRLSGDYYFTSSSHPPAAAATATDDDIIPPIYAYTPNVLSSKILTYLSRRFVSRDRQQTHGGSALAGFLALLLVTCANCMLGPMRDAAALAVGVSHIPALTLASTVLALGSSVPVGWLFEAPDPRRRRVWKRMGLTRGETQGTSLALFYRVFAFLLLSYALGFVLVDIYGGSGGSVNGDNGSTQKVMEEPAIASIVAFFLRTFIGMGVSVSRIKNALEQLPGLERRMNAFVILETCSSESIPSLFLRAYSNVLKKFGKVIYIMFFLVVHLMKLHSLSLIWGVTTEAMEYEENAEQRRDAAAKEREGMRMNLISSTTRQQQHSPPRSPPMTLTKPSKSSLRLKRLGFVGFGGTLGGILGSVIASFAAHILNLSGLLILAAILLELSANLSVELGRIMQRHWEEQMKYASTGDLSSLSSSQDLAEQANKVDSSLRKSTSMGTMKRVASGSLSSGNLLQLAAQQEQMQKDRAKMAGSGDAGMTHARSTGSISIGSTEVMGQNLSNTATVDSQPLVDDNSFKQRLLRGVTTILRSRLLMSIFTYNALSASASVLLSFQRAALVANRSSIVSSAVTNTAYLAKINTASSVAVFALQASGLGAYIASSCGQRGTLALMPVIRLFSVVLLGWWHLMSDGRPPNLIMFLMIDEFAKVINFAIAKPVRENLWRGLSAEARYEAKPIVDTLANRWGGGSAAFLVSFINGVTDLTGLLVVNEKTGEQSIFGFPPVLLLCMIISAWWLAVTFDVGNIRRRIDLELKKQQ